MPKLTCALLTYNEIGRIGRALRHARQWADEILVFDKGSTDGTPSAATRAGARVVTIPFSLQGHEDPSSFPSYAANDWIVGLTPGEIPTRPLIAELKALLAGRAEEIDLILLPIVLWSFGEFLPGSPWSAGYQPRVYHRARVTVQNVVHDNFRADPARTVRIPARADCYVLHQTHPTAAAFVETHAAYMAAETLQDPVRRYAVALQQLTAFDPVFRAPEMALHLHAWKLYWHGVALYCLEKMRAADVPAEYAERAEALLVSEWTAAIP